MNHTCDDTRPQWRLMPAEASPEMCEAVVGKWRNSGASAQAVDAANLYRAYVLSAPHPEPKLLTAPQTQKLVHQAKSATDLVQLVERAVYANLGIDCTPRPAMDHQLIQKIRQGLQSDMERAGFDTALRIIAGAGARTPANLCA